MSYIFKDVSFNTIVQNGNLSYGSFIPLFYSTSNNPYEIINPTPGDVTSGFITETSAPIGMRTAAMDSRDNGGSVTVTAPIWATHFKCRVTSRAGARGIFFQSSQAGHRGPDPNNMQFGHDGLEISTSGYTPIGPNRSFQLITSNSPQALNAVNNGTTFLIGANNGADGQNFQEGHTRTPGQFGPARGPHANVGSNLSNSTNFGRGQTFNSNASIFWFS